MLELIKINQENQYFIPDFLNNAGKALTTFRYYEKRDLSILSNHLITCVLMYDSKPIGYGHLDKEGNDIWLGIAVADDYQGKGFGNFIINYLVEFAISKKLPCIKLSVDIGNLSAISLYKKIGFILDFKYSESSLIFKKILNA